jgi:hypothetical protein
VLGSRRDVGIPPGSPDVVHRSGDQAIQKQARSNLVSFTERPRLSSQRTRFLTGQALPQSPLFAVRQGIRLLSDPPKN